MYVDNKPNMTGTIIVRGDGYIASRDEDLSRYKLVMYDSAGNITGTNFYITKEELYMGIDHFENGETQYKSFGTLRDGSVALEVINVNRMKKTVDRSYAIAEVTESKTQIKESFKEIGELAKAVVYTEYGIDVDKLKDAFLNYVLTDLEAATNPSYIIELLERVGVDEELANAIGLQRLLEMNREDDRE